MKELQAETPDAERQEPAPAASAVGRRVNVVERAFQLADDPRFLTVYEIRLGLMREGYGLVVLAHLDGISICRQLRSRIAARKRAASQRLRPPPPERPGPR